MPFLIKADDNYSKLKLSNELIRRKLESNKIQISLEVYLGKDLIERRRETITINYQYEVIYNNGRPERKEHTPEKKTDEPQSNNVAEIEREPIKLKADKSLMSPLEILRPLPKAPQRKNSKKNNRKRRSTAILTDTPIKDALEDEKAPPKRKSEYGDWINLKILEITPELTTLGNTLAEALELQKAHDEVLRQLQNKQSPVEELLRQADQLIATQKPRAEVYAAMAESLGRAWKDINSHLELRKHILDLNVLYHTKAQEFFEKMDALEASCKDTIVPIEIEAVKEFLTTIHEQRRALLESLMGALQAGNSLLAKLKELGAEGTLDSRPERIRSSVKKAISQVQDWMDELHVRRQTLEITFNSRKTQLEQCLALAILAADLRELEDAVQNRRELLANSNQYGDSSSSAELLLHEHKKLLPEAKQLQERALKITKATEQLVAAGCFAGEQATAQSYIVLSATSDYLTDLQNRESLLERVIAFFRSAHTVITKLEQLEIQLTATELSKTSPQLAQLHAQCAKAIEEATAAPIAEGYAILDVADSDTSGTEGVRRMVQELENRKIVIEALCTAHKEENIRINTALNNFLERHNEIYTWLVTIAEAFLQRHQDMGSDSPMSKDFFDLHNQLLTDLQTKGNEINALLLTLPPILEYLEDNQRKDVDVKVEQLHDRWMKLKNILENRMELSRIYVKFHMEADVVNKEMDALESLLLKNKDSIDDDAMKHIEEKFESIVPLYQCAKNTGITFINEAKLVSEPHLDTKRACLCVESVLERLSGRQLVVTRNWQTFHTEVVEKRELLVHLEQTMAESTKTINWVSKMDSQLYPVITTSSTKPSELADHVENKLTIVLPDIRKAQAEVDQRIKTAESLISRAPSAEEKSHNITNKLHDLYQRLSEISSEYQILLQVLIGYFRNLEEIDKKADDLNAELERSGYPKDISSIESILRDHESCRQTIVERLRFAQTECDQISERIRKQADEWFREGSKLLVTIARKSTIVKRPEEAQQLLNEISTFLKPGEEKQNERIKQISELALQLYGPDETKHAPVLHSNKEMLESFSSITKELNTLADNLRAAEIERQRVEREKEEARLAEERRRLEESRAAEEKRIAEEAKGKLQKGRLARREYGLRN
ncbi:hypothetical protein JTB14_030240 [Gonioctena quinquepunctata]|nr:hypothetical protein JTB14_030240 [Gonioctena quinquepunctata]